MMMMKTISKYLKDRKLPVALTEGGPLNFILTHRDGPYWRGRWDRTSETITFSSDGKMSRDWKFAPTQPKGRV